MHGFLLFLPRRDGGGYISDEWSDWPGDWVDVVTLQGGGGRGGNNLDRGGSFVPSWSVLAHSEAGGESGEGGKYNGPRRQLHPQLKRTGPLRSRREGGDRKGEKMVIDAACAAPTCGMVRIFGQAWFDANQPPVNLSPLTGTK